MLLASHKEIDQAIEMTAQGQELTIWQIQRFLLIFNLIQSHIGGSFSITGLSNNASPIRSSREGSPGPGAYDAKDLNKPITYKYSFALILKDGS